MHTAFDRMAARASAFMGSLAGFCSMLIFIVACLALGPFLGWIVTQIILTTALTVVTQMTAMLLQSSQSRQEHGMQQKLDEIIKVLPDADNRLRGIEKQGDLPCSRNSKNPP